MERSERLTDLPNIGKVAESNLMQVGIFTASALRQTGSKEAFLKIRTLNPGACLHLLYALEGGVQNIRYPDLSSEKKDELRKFYKNLPSLGLDRQPSP